MISVIYLGLPEICAWSYSHALTHAVRKRVFIKFQKITHTKLYKVKKNQIKLDLLHSFSLKIHSLLVVIVVHCQKIDSNKRCSWSTLISIVVFFVDGTCKYFKPWGILKDRVELIDPFETMTQFP